MYRRESDPWRMRTSDYEREKYIATIGLLPDRRIRSGLEVGCSIGVLTRLLAAHCENLLALDVDEVPLSRARQTCGECANVEFAKIVVPGEWPAGMFDLMVLSEILYFLDPHDIAATARRAEASATQDTVIILVNWLGRTDGPCDGDTAAELFIARSRPAFAVQNRLRTQNYRMDVLARG